MRCLWIRRPDLVSTPHDNGGWVVKDPVTLQYALLTDFEHHILNLLDGRRSAHEILRQAADRFPAVHLTREHLASFLRQLAASQLIRVASPGESVRLQNGRVPRGRKLLTATLSVLRIQFRLLNPQPWLDRLLPWLTILNGRLVWSAVLLLLSAAAMIVLTQTRSIVSAVPAVSDFTGPQNLLSLLLIYVVVKALHEAGHALTARWFGAECPECGVLLMVFTPVLYTDVTDTWRLSRGRRMLVTAAGIGVELVVAALCLVLWWAAEPGWTRAMLLNTALLCSLNTVLFNGNPLLRFDGYFLLSDAVRIPNLAARSSLLLQNLCVRLLTGRSVHYDAATPAEQRFMLIYGVLAGLYRLFLTVAILQLVDHVSRAWQIQIVGQLLSFVVLCGLLVIPSWNMVQRIRGAVEMQKSGWTGLLRISVVVGCLIVLINVPLPQSVVAPASVQPTCRAVYASVPGRLRTFQSYGRPAGPDDCLVQLENEGLQHTRSELAADVRRLRTELDALLDNPATADAAVLPTLRSSLEAATGRLAEFESELDQLCVRAKVEGIFLPPPHVPREQRSDLPEHWSGIPAAEVNRGAWIERGTLLGYVGLPTDTELHVALTEQEIERIRPGQTVRFGRPGQSRLYPGTVTTVSEVPSERLPSTLLISGLVDGRMEQDAVIPANVTYPATIELDQTGLPTVPLYAVGQVRIQTKPASVWQRVVRYLRQTF